MVWLLLSVSVIVLDREEDSVVICDDVPDVNGELVAVVDGLLEAVHDTVVLALEDPDDETEVDLVELSELVADDDPVLVPVVVTDPDAVPL